MSKRIKYTVLAVVAAALCVGAAEMFFAPPVQAGPTCWQVDCNTCCRGKGGVICTQRACV
jgi:hypothetical protein